MTVQTIKIRTDPTCFHAGSRCSVISSLKNALFAIITAISNERVENLRANDCTVLVRVMSDVTRCDWFFFKQSEFFEHSSTYCTALVQYCTCSMSYIIFLTLLDIRRTFDAGSSRQSSSTRVPCVSINAFVLRPILRAGRGARRGLQSSLFISSAGRRRIGERILILIPDS